MHDGLFLFCLLLFLTGWGFYMHSLDGAPIPPKDPETWPQTPFA